MKMSPDPVLTPFHLPMPTPASKQVAKLPEK